MTNIEIKPSPLKGEIRVPPSKSMSHRAIICSSLSQGVSIIDNIILSDDILASLEAMKSFGVEIGISELDENGICKLTIVGRGKLKLTNNQIDCKESGSTLRFLIPMAGLLGERITYIGRGKLLERPLDTYYEIFEDQGISYINDNGKLPLSIEGELKPGTFRVKGNISSQFITGLLFVLPLLKGDSKIIITTDLESRGYVDLTLDMLKKFSIKVENKDYRKFYIRGNQKYKARNYRVEGDFSQSAFFIVAGLLGEEIICKGLNMDSLQGDKVILDIVRDMGGNIAMENNFIKISKSNTKAMTIDVAQCPDLVPILAVLGGLSKGRTRIINAQRLRIKESDRLKAIATELNKLGANIRELEDGLEIDGVEELEGGRVSSWNDHRIAMALAIASIKCKSPLIIENSGAVEKSYPNFWKDFVKLGGMIK